ncbi:MAG TPA: transporter, partial [Acidiferrobacterales bacterium]|nr:transporter [Acidiferrobacterales bacterium]
MKRTERMHGVRFAAGGAPPAGRCRVAPRHRRAVVVFLVLGLAVFSRASLAADGQVYLALDGGVQAGDFGTPVRNTLYSVAPTLGYVAKDYDLSVTAPYLSLTQSTAGQSVTESGLGDIVARAGYVLVPERESGLSLNGALAVKLPTADDAKGLGTGKADVGATLMLGQRLGPVRLSLLGGYIKVGDPAGQDYNDVYLYGAG